MVSRIEITLPTIFRGYLKPSIYHSNSLFRVCMEWSLPVGHRDSTPIILMFARFHIPYAYRYLVYYLDSIAVLQNKHPRNRIYTHLNVWLSLRIFPCVQLKISSSSERLRAMFIWSIYFKCSPQT